MPVARFASGWLILATTACQGPAMKPEAFDPEVLSAMRHSGRLRPGEEDEHVVELVPDWMEVDPSGPLTFAQLRDPAGPPIFCLVLASQPAADRLALLPLAPEETPLEVLERPDRRRELTEVRRRFLQGEVVESALDRSLSEVIRDSRLGPPLPTPRVVLAVAANFPSHLVHDLGIDPALVEPFSRTPARVFQKHPPLLAPGSEGPPPPFLGVIGPFDTVLYPRRVWLPANEEGASQEVDTHLDYEVEVGIVLGRTLTAQDVLEASDEELWEAVAGYVLVSDIKPRDPQVFERILHRRLVPTETEQLYLTGDPQVDRIIGGWNETTCAWWSYAASQGDYAALGPFFVAASGTPSFPPRAVICARSYAPEAQRGAEIPGDRESDTLYLRQCARVTDDPLHPDRMLWSVPEVLRGALLPGGALALGSQADRLETGDVVALGTPGGIALTVRRTRMLRMLDRILFWWDARDWHEAFFGRDAPLYLREGDRLFLWGEGLGFQHLKVQPVPLEPEGEGESESGNLTGT
ncbi:MAG TPA: fumarylacetoacetate hydrolase family protein [Candidatus Polarisedimenticolia bacterium]|nr:fumarylacetoacetate hydrolase family protein [Candidatus Polarisedimenticolia bacterium]